MLAENEDTDPYLRHAGIMGLVFAALIAAIVSSLASMMNSTSTIFTMDLYRNYFKKELFFSTACQPGRMSAVISRA